MKSKDRSTPSLNEIIDQATDGYNCNLKEKGLVKCFQELDSKVLFRTRHYKKCLELEREFQHCLVYSNERNLNKRTEYKGEINKLEIYEKNKEWKLDNKKDAFDFVEGKKSESEILNKETNVRKKVVEL